jgi:hypothetical protein
LVAVVYKTILTEEALATENLHTHRHLYNRIPEIENYRLGLVQEGEFTLFNVGHGVHDEYL